MRLRKQLEQLEAKVCSVEATARRERRDAAKRLKMLECPHITVTHVRFGSIWTGKSRVCKYLAKCVECGKELRMVSEEEYLEIQKDKLAAELKDVKAKITAAKKK